ncbi:MAG: ATP-binding protein [Gammaproteobacteria bacterium]
MFRSAVEKAGVRLVVDCPPPRSPAFVDPEMWETIVLNLVSNAFKFTFDGEIRVQLREHEGHFELSVSDTGVGIAPSELPRLFERFHRVRGTRARTFEGTGIGLALVRELARLHGGDITVSSREGAGSTFVVTIPVGSAHLPAEQIGGGRQRDIGSAAMAFIHEAERWLPQEQAGVGELRYEPSVGAAVPQTEVSPAQTRRPRIVLADDNADMRGYLARLLSPQYAVEAVADGAAALERIKANPPDLVLTDVMMPRLDGFGLLKALRANERVRSIPVIILSARAGEEASVEGLAQGADDYLSKPFSACDLLARVRAQIEMRRRTVQFETLLNEAPLGVYLVDADFRIRQVNPRARPAFGDIPDLIGRDFEEVVRRLWPKDAADEVVRIFRHTLETGEPHETLEHIEHRLDRNVTEYYEWRIDRMPLPEGGYGVVCYFRDISAQVKARASLQQSEGRFRAFVTASSDVVYTMSADWREMRQLTSSGFIPDTPSPSRDWLDKYIHPDDRAQVLAAIERAIATKGTFELEHRVVRTDGTLGWTFSRAIPLLDGKGEIVEWFGAARDITERKRAEEALARLTDKAEQERRLYLTILSSTPDLVYVFDRKHRFIYANDALLTMWGRTWGDAIGKNCLELGYEPWHAEMHDREIEQVIATKQPIRGQVPFTGTHGRRIYDYIFVPVIGTDGEVEAIAGTTRDVTEHKQSEDRLRDADRRKDEFIAMLAHELRNPLAPIANAVQLLRLAIQEDELQAKARAIIERQTAQLARFVDDLLDVSRITSGRLQLRREPVAIAGVVERAVESVRPLIEQRRHILTVSVAATPIYVDGDATRLEQVVVNLLNNAAKYTDPGGRIDLAVETENGQVVLRIKDTGIGIDAELRPRLFEPFVQAKRSLDRSHGGLGIGLSLVQRLVEMHDGTIEVTSAVGQGSTFAVRLPAVSASTAPVPMERPETATLPGQPLRLLVVDDNVDAAQSLAILLTGAGHSVHTAYDGREALDMARKCRPHVAFVDIGLPELDGYEVARRLRGDPALRHTKLVAMTGYGQADDRRRSLAAGFDRHLVKPAEFPKMLEILSEVSERLAS